MSEAAFLKALRATLVATLTLIDARLETLLGRPPVATGPDCPNCHRSRHVAEIGNGEFVCGECDHNWGADDGDGAD